MFSIIWQVKDFPTIYHHVRCVYTKCNIVTLGKVYLGSDVDLFLLACTSFLPVMTWFLCTEWHAHRPSINNGKEACRLISGHSDVLLCQQVYKYVQMRHHVRVDRSGEKRLSLSPSEKVEDSLYLRRTHGVIDCDNTYLQLSIIQYRWKWLCNQSICCVVILPSLSLFKLPA